MKIAVAFFGIPRNSAVCYPSIERNILGSLPVSAEVFCFYHLYRLEEVNNPRSGERGSFSQENYECFKWMEGELEDPGFCLDRWGFEAIKKYGDTWGDNYRSIRNLIHQLNSLHAVTALLASSDPDFVVYVRPDIFYHDALPSYIFSNSKVRCRNVYVPNWQWWGGVNDRFAICGRDSFRIYGNRAEDMQGFCSSTGRPLHSEKLLKHSLVAHGARVCTIDTTASRVRLDGRFADESFSSTRSMGRRENRFFHKVSRVRTVLDRFAFSWF